MRWILATTLALALAWGGYWVWGAQALRGNLRIWMDSNQIQGTPVVEGFPNRFDITVTDPQIDQIGYSAPFFQVFSMTWKPWHLIAAFAPSQRLRAFDQMLTLTSPHLLASVISKPFGAYSLQDFRLDGQDLGLSSDQGWQMSAAHLTVALDAKDDPLAPRLGGRMTDVAAMLRLPNMPEKMDLVSLDTHVKLARPLDADSTIRDVLGLDITRAQLVWGDFTLGLQGRIAPDTFGFVAGDLRLTVQGAQHLPQVLAALGLLSADQSASLGKILVMNDVTLPLTLSEGVVRIGPLPLGAAPLWPH